MIFGDLAAYLLATQETLDDLNLKLNDKVCMKNFRPNIVIEGCDPYDEVTFKMIM